MKNILVKILKVICYWIVFILFFGIVSAVFGDGITSVITGVGFIFLVIFSITTLLKKTSGSSKPFSLFQSQTNIPEGALRNAYEDIREQFLNGEMANQMDSPVILKKNEILIFTIPGVALCEEKTVKTKGSMQGVSIRVMKGVSYRVGGFEASSQKKIVELDKGTLTVTNKRLSFSGKTHSVDFPLSKINAIKPLETGISISRSGKQRVEYFLGTSNVSITVTVHPEKGESFEPEETTYKFSGDECKEVLTRLIQNSE